MSRQSRLARETRGTGRRSRVLTASAAGLALCLFGGVALAVPGGDPARADAFLTMDSLTSGFQLGVVHAASDTVQALGVHGSTVAFEVPEAARGTFGPGTVATGSVRLFNNSPTLDARLTVTVAEAAEPGDPEMLDAVRVSMRARFGDGRTVDLMGTPDDPAAGGVGLAEATTSVEELLTARGAEALAEGVGFDAGAPGSEVTIDLWFHLTPTEELSARQSGSTAVAVHIEGSTT